MAPESQTQTQTEKVSSSATPPQVKEDVKPEMKPEVKPESTSEKSEVISAGLKPIYFDFDKSFIRDDSMTVMKANVEWLRANPSATIRIEGNCDERGTVEYNQALGQRRAASAKKYLTDMGVVSSRISLISYGKEKPICSESTEKCWQKNRRDDFVFIGQ